MAVFFLWLFLCLYSPFFCSAVNGGKEIKEPHQERSFRSGAGYDHV